MGCDQDMRTAVVLKELTSKFPDTCGVLSREGKLKYIDGHTHCNHVEYDEEGAASGADTKKGVSSAASPPGFMIGGHGMSDCGQYGFAYIDSYTSDAKFKIYYFEEFNGLRPNDTSKYDEITDCVKTHQAGIAGCVHLASTWFELDWSAHGDREDARVVIEGQKAVPSGSSLKSAHDRAQADQSYFV